MAIFLSWNNNGKKKRVELFTGAVLGRKKADFSFDDPQVSGKHAYIEKNSKNEFVLIDNNSRNGIIYQNETVKKLTLTNGVVFKLGRFEIKVTEKSKLTSKAPISAPLASPEAKALDEQASKDKWKEELLELNSAALKKKSPKINELTPFSPLIELKFLSGEQKGTKWLLGYGPRKIGKHSIEFPITEKNSPDICFTLSHDDEGHIFTTNNPKTVFLNQVSSKKEKILHKDKISIGDTIIEIGFVHV